MLVVDWLAEATIWVAVGVLATSSHLTAIQTAQEWTAGRLPIEKKSKYHGTYNIRDSSVVTHPSTSLTMVCSMGERTGSQIPVSISVRGSEEVGGFHIVIRNGSLDLPVRVTSSLEAELTPQYELSPMYRLDIHDTKTNSEGQLDA